MRLKLRRTEPIETEPTETEDAADEPEHGPLRRCIVTRESGDRARMIRFVVSPDGVVVPDLTARLPGRGIWLSAQTDVLETARKKGSFARAARRHVRVPEDLAQIVQDGLARRVGELLGLARRAGQAVCGFQKAREWLAAGRAGLVIQAHDGSVEERTRFLAGSRDVAVAAPLAAAALGAVFGRDHVVHVAVASGRLAEALRNETERLSGFTGKVRATGTALPRRVDDSQGG
jgi:predicted RNA-binding protein YlxR (DUF448 family)